MGDFRDTSINTGFDKRSHEEMMRLQRIEEQKQKAEEDDQEEDHQEQSQALILAEALLTMINHGLRKCIDTFPAHLQDTVQDSGIQLIHHFQTLLERLQKKDLGEDPDYATELSRSWDALNEYIALAQTKTHAKAQQQLKALIHSINEHPKESEHSLGFYLSAHTGEDWLPFPFISLLSELHQNHILAPSSSILNEWIKSCKQILELLSAKQPPSS